MAYETERRFLVKADVDIEGMSYRKSIISQSYLPSTGDWVIRARKSYLDIPGEHTDRNYTITMKKAVSDSTNVELEYSIDAIQYEDFVSNTKSTITKTRYYIQHEKRTWEVDVYPSDAFTFHAIAEIELESEDAEVSIPDWVGQEITGNRAYSNFAIAKLLEQSSTFKEGI